MIYEPLDDGWSDDFDLGEEEDEDEGFVGYSNGTGCCLGERCLAPDPVHLAHECFDRDMAEAWQAEAERHETDERIRALIDRLPERLRWAPHNLFAHPVSEVLYHLGFEDLSNRLHDATVPTHEEGRGRG